MVWEDFLLFSLPRLLLPLIRMYNFHCVLVVFSNHFCCFVSFEHGVWMYHFEVSLMAEFSSRNTQMEY